MNKEFLKKYPTYKYYYKNYLGAWSFIDGEKVLTINDFDEVTVHDPITGKSETKMALYFDEEELPMILNPTNAETIGEVLGTANWAKWIGQKIIVGASKIKVGGKPTDAVRVRNKKPDNAVYTCEDCGQVLKPVAGKNPSELAEIAKRNTGKILCVDCMRKVKAEQDGNQ